MTQRRSIFGLDFLLIAATLALMVMGVLFIYSSGVSSTGVVFSNEYIKQIVWAVTGIILMVVVGMSDYSRLRDWSFYIYAFLMFLLIVTLVVGKRVYGARSWLGLLHAGIGIQPSEFAKIGTILLLGSWLASNRERAQRLSTFVVAFLITLLPMLLILVEPDLGTALVYFPIFVIMTYVAGAKRRHVMFVLLSAALLVLLTTLSYLKDLQQSASTSMIELALQHSFLHHVALAILAVIAVSLIGLYFFKRRYFYWITWAFSSILTSIIGTLAVTKVLKPYQVMRLVSFLDPQIDPRGSGWNIIQSVTAVGSGGFFGKGFLHGTQSHYHYIPQQSTDFIFSIFSEEWGFVGGLALFSLFLVIFIRGLRIVAATKDPYAAYIGSGVVGMIFFHFTVNVGMAMGIMPITGIPLTFLSYGGSALWTALIGIGLLVNIHYRRYY